LIKILAIESSCDETSAAVVSGGKPLSNVISSQHFHSKYGGVVPELASRAHLQSISEIVRHSLVNSNCTIEDIDAIAVTTSPGLAGSLIVGANFAKGLALKYDLPIIPVNHIEGHIYSGFLQDEELTFPFVNLVVSGGHTALFFVESFEKYLLIGSTIDDAAGEAFDKIGSMLGLDYPAGPRVDKAAAAGNPLRFNFPRSMLGSNDLNFSFSGLKTSVRYFLEKEYNGADFSLDLNDLCASVQQAIVDVLVAKTIRAASVNTVHTIVVGGGVSANSQLRRDLMENGSAKGLKIILPDLAYCMDNAAMIGYVAELKFANRRHDNDYRNLEFRVNAKALRANNRKTKYFKENKV